MSSAVTSEVSSLALSPSALRLRAEAGERTIDVAEFPIHLARPAGRPKGALILIHEIWGLVPHITSIADRFAAEGYLVLAPDLLSSIGIDAHVGEELNQIRKSQDERVRSEGQPRLRAALAPMGAPEYAAWALAALEACVDRLEQEPGIDGRIAVTGFCFGGSYSFAIAAADPRIRAAVPFYGTPPETARISKIAGPVLAFYGDADDRLMESLPEVTASMQAAGIDFTAKVYPGAGHAFFNDTNSFTYQADAADDAWARTLRFLDRELAAG